MDNIFKISNDTKVTLTGDAALGVGFFETIKLKNGSPVFLKKHLQRLDNSLSQFKLGKLPDYFAVEKSIVDFLSDKRTVNKALKIIAVDKTLYYMLRSVNVPMHPVFICISDKIKFSNNPLVNHKSISYFFNKLLLAEADEKKAFDSIALNEKGFVTEGGKTNIFVLKNKKLYTPFENNGCLNGIMRQFVMEKFKTAEKNISLDFLLSANEIFLTNAVVGVVSVRKIVGYKKVYDNKFTSIVQKTVC
jgi:4-amino-4-deoxychorismate lyase